MILYRQAQYRQGPTNGGVDAVIAKTNSFLGQFATTEWLGWGRGVLGAAVIERLERDAEEEAANRELMESIAAEEADLKRKRTASSPVSMEVDEKPWATGKKTRMVPEVVMIKRNATVSEGMETRGKGKAKEVVEKAGRERHKRAKQDWSTVPKDAKEVS